MPGPPGRGQHCEALRWPANSATKDSAPFLRPVDRFERRTARRWEKYAAPYRLGAIVAKGTAKCFNATKGYGFIQPVGGGRDVFVHISAVERAGLSTLNEGQAVEYEEVSNRGKTSAANLKVAGR
jgi:CspA family cold shock protein